MFKTARVQLLALGLALALVGLALLVSARSDVLGVLCLALGGLIAVRGARLFARQDSRRLLQPPDDGDNPHAR